MPARTAGRRQAPAGASEAMTAWLDVSLMKGGVRSFAVFLQGLLDGIETGKESLVELLFLEILDDDFFQFVAISRRERLLLRIGVHVHVEACRLLAEDDVDTVDAQFLRPVEGEPREELLLPLVLELLFLVAGQRSTCLSDHV